LKSGDLLTVEDQRVAIVVDLSIEFPGEDQLANKLLDNLEIKVKGLLGLGQGQRLIASLVGENEAFEC